MFISSAQVQYLGHVVSAGGIECDPKLTSAVKSWPVPSDVKALRKFLGFTGYFRRFIRDYARLTAPLNHLLKGQVCGHGRSKKVIGRKPKNLGVAPVPWEWGEGQKKAFDILKELLMSPPILAYPDYNKPFVLQVDASGKGLGGVLCQKDDFGKLRVIAYGSRSLKLGERNYTTHKLEFLALKWAVTQKFRDYLYGNKCLVVTDHNPLTNVLTTAKLDATGHNWLAAIGTFDLVIKYCPGKDNGLLLVWP